MELQNYNLELNFVHITLQMNPKTRAMLKCDLHEKHLLKSSCTIVLEEAILSWKLCVRLV